MLFYNMGNNFFNKFLRIYTGIFSQVTYYRLLAPIILDLRTIIYLGGDTITLKDLNDNE